MKGEYCNLSLVSGETETQSVVKLVQGHTANSQIGASLALKAMTLLLHGGTCPTKDVRPPVGNT